MSAKYFDICDTAFKMDLDSGGIKILRSAPDGIIKDEPTKYEESKFIRNREDRSVIDKETAYKLAVNLSLSY